MYGHDENMLKSSKTPKIVHPSGFPAMKTLKTFLRTGEPVKSKVNIPTLLVKNILEVIGRSLWMTVILRGFGDLFLKLGDGKIVYSPGCLMTGGSERLITASLRQGSSEHGYI